MSATAFCCLLETVPDMMKHLSKRSTRELSATNRAFWQHIQQGTTSISISHIVDPSYDMDLLVRKARPHLRRLELVDNNGILCQATFQAVLSQGQWPLLTRLTLTSDDRQYMSDDCPLPGDHFHFVGAVWRLLEHLDLSNNILDFDSWAHLATGDWPCLKMLNLSCCGAHQRKLAVLAQGSWRQLEGLDLSCQELNVYCVRELTGAHWPCLKKLSLSHCALTDDSIPVLVIGPWLALEYLGLQGNSQLTTKAFDGLVTARWPNMHMDKYKYGLFKE